VSPYRRRCLALLTASAWPWPAPFAAGLAAQPATDPNADPVRRGRAIVFPRDHGAHLGVRTEWWYVTGWLAAASDPASATDPGAKLSHGFQVTFFRSRTGLAQDLSGRFAPRQLLFAHAAITELAGKRHWHDQRIVRWSEAPAAATGHAAVHDAELRLGAWWLQRQAGDEKQAWISHVSATDFDLHLTLSPSQTRLLQGDAGFSRKGPDETQASHYYSLPQLSAQARLAQGGQPRKLQGRAWLDHEWSDTLLHPEAVGWDWIGMNLFDGSALTAFMLRRKDGSAVWAGGSFRPGQSPGSPGTGTGTGTGTGSFEPRQVRWTPGRLWRSPASAANYPVDWQVQTPAGTFEVRSLLDSQELDSRASTGSIYWEGLAELLDSRGTRVGLGYLEMTGYAGRLRL